MATLTVTDEDNNSDSDEVTIEASKAVGNPPVAVIRDEAGYEISEDRGNNTVTVTSPFVLDGGDSYDQDGDDLSYSWEVASVPEGSANATISGADQADAIFTPDVTGAYLIRLTVSDPTGNTNAAEITVIANASPVEVSGTLSADTVWKDIFADPNVPDYLAVGNVNVAAALTVEPGVVVHFDEDVLLTIQDNGGSLVANGTAEQGIVFTSSDVPGEVHWGGLLVNSSSGNNLLNYTTVSYAGGDDIIYQGGYRQAGIAVANDGRLKMTNSSVLNNAGDGMFTVGSSSLSQFENNSFANNENYAMSISINQAGVIDAATAFTDNGDTDKRENVVRIYDSSLSEDQTWVALSNSASYVMVGNVTVSADLTVSAGARLEFAEDVVMTVASGGVLVADGTSDNKIIFTSSSPADDQYWAGLLFQSSSTQNLLNYVEVSYAGGDDIIYYGGYRKASIAIADDARVGITNTEVVTGEGHGVFAGESGGLTTFSANSFQNIASYPLYLPANLVGMVDANTTITNNADNVVAMYASTLNGDASYVDPADPKWVTLAENAQYLATGKLTVSDDLVLAEGAYLAFGEQVVMQVTSSGSLKAVGTATNPVTLTAYEQSGNDNWGGLLIQSDDDNELTNAEVSYAGKEDQLIYISGYRSANIAVSGDGSLTLNGTIVSNSDANGLVVASGGEINGLTNADTDPATTVEGANTFSGNDTDNVVFF